MASDNGRVGFVSLRDVKVEPMDPGVSRQILGYDTGMMMVRVSFKKGAVGYVHNHPHRQASYVESGRFEAQVGGEKKVLGPGDSFFVTPDVPHGVTALEDGVLIDVFTPRRDDFLA